MPGIFLLFIAWIVFLNSFKAFYCKVIFFTAQLLALRVVKTALLIFHVIYPLWLAIVHLFYSPPRHTNSKTNPFFKISFCFFFVIIQTARLNKTVPIIFFTRFLQKPKKTTKRTQISFKRRRFFV